MKGFQCIIKGFFGYRVYKDIKGVQYSIQGIYTRVYRVYKSIQGIQGVQGIQGAHTRVYRVYKHIQGVLEYTGCTRGGCTLPISRQHMEACMILTQH